MPTVTLIPFDRATAADVLERRRRDDWAAGYPTPGDVVIAGKLLDGSYPAGSDAAPWGMWSIVVDGVVVGGAGIKGAPDETGRIEIGYGIAEEHRGRGITSAAVLRLLDLAARAGASSAFATTDPDNLASQGVLRHCGFAYAGESDGELRWTLEPLPESRA